MLLVHVGYAKTGTTFLQKRLFPHLPNTNYLGRTYCDITGAPKENLWDLTTYVNGKSGADPHQVGGWLVANMRDGLNIISQETLLLPHQTEIGAARLAYVTRGIETRILITIRRQEAMIWSRYVHDRTQTKHIIPAYSLANALVA